jgi:toxin ParE1/3/4
VTKQIVQRPRAGEDIDQIFSWFRRDSVLAAASFLDAVQAAFELLAEHPGIGSTRHAEYCADLPSPLRFHPIKRFPRYLVYYLERPEAVEVIRIWDAARGLDALMEDME